MPARPTSTPSSATMFCVACVSQSPSVFKIIKSLCKSHNKHSYIILFNWSAVADPGFPRLGTPNSKAGVNLLFGENALENFMKRKEIGQRGGVHPLCPGCVNDFFRNIRSWDYLHFCAASNGNKLEIVSNQINLSTNLYLSRVYWIKTNVIVTPCGNFNKFGVFLSIPVNSD